ncbi:MAG: sucrase ferredoxin [Nocardioides sp.]|nr:sucrase ferredoxin [Nocardioides sp.]
MSEPEVVEKRFRCAVGALGAPMAGSAGEESSFLLIEYSGAWGRKALEESRLPEEVRVGLAEGAAEAGVRVMLIRRHGRSVADSEEFRVFLCHASAHDPWVETTRLGVAEDLLDLDLDGLAAGRSTGLERYDDALLLVCTNGRRDACCAEFGRPVAAEVAAAHPEQTWEVTHLGGHRFASAMLTLPHGLSYGRLDPHSASLIADLTLEGRLDPMHLRGRTAYDAPVQAAEIALLEELSLDRVDALDLAGSAAVGDGQTRVRFLHDGEQHTLMVTPRVGEAVRASCGDEKVKPAPGFLTERI